MVSLSDIRRIFKGDIRISEPLAKYTSFRIGGPADYFVEPVSKEDLVSVVTYFRQNTFPFIIIGNGSNLLVSDDGYRGAVVNLETGLSAIRMAGDSNSVGEGIVYVEAGLRLAKFVDFCIQHSLKGTEMLAGIPGTLGGAVIMNAGAYGGEISDYMDEVELLRDDSRVKIRKKDGGFAYRRSGFSRDIVLAAIFRLPGGDKEELMRVRRELLIKRNAAQPVNLPNAGSVFKNPPGNFAAKLIQEAGLKGRTHGEAMISERHANFIVNNGGAKATDVLALIRNTQRVVKKKFNVVLELEVKLIGFDDHALREVA